MRCDVCGAKLTFKNAIIEHDLVWCPRCYAKYNKIRLPDIIG